MLVSEGRLPVKMSIFPRLRVGFPTDGIAKKEPSRRVARPTLNRAPPAND